MHAHKLVWKHNQKNIWKMFKKNYTKWETSKLCRCVSLIKWTVEMICFVDDDDRWL